MSDTAMKKKTRKPKALKIMHNRKELWLRPFDLPNGELVRVVTWLSKVLAWKISLKTEGRK